MMQFKTGQTILWNFVLSSFNLTYLTLDRYTDIICPDYFKVIIFQKKKLWNIRVFQIFGLRDEGIDS